MSLFLNHGKRVGFPTTLRTLIRGHGLSFAQSDGVNKSMCVETFWLGVYLLDGVHES